VKVIICGATGRMGQAILSLLEQEKDMTLGAALENKGHAAIGKNAGQWAGKDQGSGIISDDIKSGLMKGDVIIDFTTPEGTRAVLYEAVLSRKPMVIGTTGFTPEEEKNILTSSKNIPIVISPNMSIGVNVLFRTLSEVATVLGDGYDVEITEMHHRHKKDAPSGTALRMGEVIASARGTTLSQVGRFSRHGIVGVRPVGEISIQSLRGGDVVGEHRVIFAGAGERIDIIHRAHSRDNFAQGALLAARWVVDQPPGLYDMMDVLGLGKTKTKPAKKTKRAGSTKK